MVCLTSDWFDPPAAHSTKMIKKNDLRYTKEIQGARRRHGNTPVYQTPESTYVFQPLLLWSTPAEMLWHVH